MDHRAIGSGSFKGGIRYLKMGQGERTLLFLAGGPGNLLPTGLAALGFKRAMRNFTARYTVHLVGRRSALPAAYSTRQMSDDLAAVVREDFQGHVDVIMGFSYGGLILQHFAADHGTLCSALVIGGAAHRVSPEALHIDACFAQLIGERKDRAAMAARAAAVAPRGLRKYALSGLLWLLGKSLLGNVSDTFRRDVLVEVAAERDHDVLERLQDIAVPVLVVSGQKDFAFPLEAVQEMARRIPHARLVIYPRGHGSLLLDKQLARDVQAFAEERLSKLTRT